MKAGRNMEGSVPPVEDGLHAKLNEKDRKRVDKERSLIDQTPYPVTEEVIVNGLKGLGLKAGMTVVSHISLSAIGWVCGGAQSVVRALKRVVTDQGSVLMPSYTGYNSNPEDWKYPPVPESWWPIIRETLPPYQEDQSPPAGMGRVVECFWAAKGTVRSNHPRSSFLAWGREAEHIVSYRGYDFPFGPQGPLGKAYDLNASILMVGVDYTIINSFYLAYHLADLESKAVEICKSVVMNRGRRQWIEYLDYQRDIIIYKEIYMTFIRMERPQKGYLGNAECLLINQKELVDFVMEHLQGRERI